MKWTDVLKHFDGDVTKATRLVTTRRGQVKGTSTDKNDGEETFLLFQAQERSFTQTSIESQTPYMHVCCIHIPVIFPIICILSAFDTAKEEVCIELGADPHTATLLMQRMSAAAQNPLQAMSDVPCPRPDAGTSGNSSETPKLPGAPAPHEQLPGKNEPEKKKTQKKEKTVKAKPLAPWWQSVLQYAIMPLLSMNCFPHV